MDVAKGVHKFKQEEFINLMGVAINQALFGK
jgi:hypothetical protein